MAVVASQQKKIQTALPLAIPFAAAWHVLIAVASIALAVRVFEGDRFRDLGDAVQNFLGIVALIPAGLAIFSTVQLFRRHPSGRLGSLTLNYVGMVLSIVYVLHLWDFFIGFDAFGQALYDNASLLWGFAIAYALYRIAAFLPESSMLHKLLQQIALIGGMGCLIVLLLLGGALDAAMHVLDQYADIQTWLATAVILVFGTVAYQILKLGDYFGETPDQRSAWQGWLMVSPNLIGFFFFFAGPLLLSFYISFTDSRPKAVPQFIDIENYKNVLSLELKTQHDLDANPQSVLSSGYLPLETIRVGNRQYVIGAKDYRFWLSLRNTIYFCLMVVPLSAIPALLLAVILNSKIPGMRFFRAVYFLPSVAAVVGTALIWSWLYNANAGYINYAISKVAAFFSFGDPKIQWLSDPGIMLFSIVILAAWQLIGFNTVLFLAGLQNIPTTLYEASFVDGASRWQQFWHITLPLLAPTTFFVVVTNVITGLQVFNEPYALITVEPLPDAAQTSVYYLYSRGFRGTFEFGYASAVAWVLFGLIFLVTLAQFRSQRSGQYDY